MSRLNLHVPAGMPDHEYLDSDFDDFFAPSPRSILFCRVVAVIVFPTSSFYFISVSLSTNLSPSIIGFAFCRSRLKSIKFFFSFFFFLLDEKYYEEFLYKSFILFFELSIKTKIFNELFRYFFFSLPEGQMFFSLPEYVWGRQILIMYIVFILSRGDAI